MSTINDLNELDICVIWDWVCTRSIDIPGYGSDSDFAPVTLTLHLSRIVMHVKLISKWALIVYIVLNNVCIICNALTLSWSERPNQPR